MMQFAEPFVHPSLSALSFARSSTCSAASSSLDTCNFDTAVHLYHPEHDILQQTHQLFHHQLAQQQEQQQQQQQQQRARVSLCVSPTQPRRQRQQKQLLQQQQQEQEPWTSVMQLISDSASYPYASNCHSSYSSSSAVAAPVASTCSHPTSLHQQLDPVQVAEETEIEQEQSEEDDDLSNECIVDESDDNGTMHPRTFRCKRLCSTASTASSSSIADAAVAAAPIANFPLSSSSCSLSTDQPHFDDRCYSTTMPLFHSHSLDFSHLVVVSPLSASSSSTSSSTAACEEMQSLQRGTSSSSTTTVSSAATSVTPTPLVRTISPCHQQQQQQQQKPQLLMTSPATERVITKPALPSSSSTTTAAAAPSTTSAAVGVCGKRMCSSSQHIKNNNNNTYHYNDNNNSKNLEMNAANCSSAASSPCSCTDCMNSCNSAPPIPTPTTNTTFPSSSAGSHIQSSLTSTSSSSTSSSSFYLASTCSPTCNCSTSSSSSCSSSTSSPSLSSSSSSSSMCWSQCVSLLSSLFRHHWGNHHASLLPTDPLQLTIFHTATTPSLDISDYFQRLACLTHCSTASLIFTAIYLQRLQQRHPHIVLSNLCAHRFVLTAFVLASKYCDDVCYNNKCMGKLGGIPTHELNTLELEFVTMLAFDLYVDTSTFERFVQQLLQLQPSLLPSPASSSFACSSHKQLPTSSPCPCPQPQQTTFEYRNSI